MCHSPGLCCRSWLHEGQDRSCSFLRKISQLYHEQGGTGAAVVHTKVRFGSGGTHNPTQHQGTATPVWIERKVSQLHRAEDWPGEFREELAPAFQLAGSGFLITMPSPRSRQNCRLRMLQLEISAVVPVDWFAQFPIHSFFYNSGVFL